MISDVGQREARTSFMNSGISAAVMYGLAARPRRSLSIDRRTGLCGWVR